VTSRVTNVTSKVQESAFVVPRDRSSLRSLLATIFLQEDVNFLVTNRIPRRYATLFMGWYSRIESPALTRLSIAVWRLFADDLRLHEAKRTNFRSLQDCFTRELREGTRPVDSHPDVIVSPCDAVVGAFGRVEKGQVFQAKGFPYTLIDLLGDEGRTALHEGAAFVTLRLKSNMYHRFHAPADARLGRVRYVSGDTWNVNPIALERVERLFCKNERAIVELSPGEDGARGATMTLVAVASVLVASIEIHAARRVFDLRYEGPRAVSCGDQPVRKGEELGLFRSGSTIVLFVNGAFDFERTVNVGTTVRMGEALLRRVATAVGSAMEGEKSTWNRNQRS
jgi:phosphatidylserine decarboxylase